MKSDLNSASAKDWRMATRGLAIRAYLPRELAWNSALMTSEASGSGEKPRARVPRPGQVLPAQGPRHR